MNIYSNALQAYLREPGRRQEDLAQQANCTQAAISRYAKGTRFPPREVAEEIEKASDGAVPMTLWRIIAAERAGLAA